MEKFKAYNKFCLVAIVFAMLMLSSAFASEPEVTVLKPASGTYVKSGDTIEIKFIVKDNDVDGNTSRWLGVELYYSTSKGGFANFINDYNLSDASKEYCSDINFLDETNCSINWTVPSISDGNYYIDLNVFDKEGTTVNDSNKASSGTFYVDNTAPTINLIYPDRVCGSILCTDNQKITFDVNDSGSGVDIATITISIQGEHSAYFNANKHCTRFDLNYRCDYNELAIVNYDNNYYIRVSAVDYSGNESELSLECRAIRPEPAQAPSAPSLTSSTHANNSWSNSKDVTITWAAVSGASGYACTWGTACAEPGTTISSESYCSARSLQQNNLSDGIYCLKVRACAANNNCSGVSTFTVKIDTVKPSTPSNLDATLESDGDIRLSWSASSDSASGVKEYRIYRDTSSNFTPSESNRKATVTGTEWTDTETKLNTTYYYKVTAVDNAGNESDAASISKATEEANITINVPSYATKGDITIRVKASIVLENAYVYVKKEHDSAWVKIKGPVTDDDFTATLTIESGDDGIAKIKVVADNLADETIKAFEIDTKPTEITWINPKPGETIKGKYLLKIKTDEPQTRIEKVTFYYNNNKIADVTQASEQNIYWVANWDTTKLSPGTYSLKAVVLDKAGNEGTATISVSVEAQPTKGKQESEAKISDANARKGQAIALLQGIKSYGLRFSKGAEDLYNAALQAMQDASNYYAQGDYEKAFDKANEAIDKFNQLSSKYGFSEKESRTKDINAQEIRKLLGARGYSQEDIEKAISSTSKANARKILKVIAVKDNNVESYYVKVYLQFRLKAKHAHLIEFVSKSLAKSANEIEASVSFEILEDDPVILFNLENLDTNETTIEYALKQPLSKNQYEQLKASNAFELSEFALVEIEEKPKPSGFDWFPVVAIVGIIAIVLILLFAYFSYAKRGKGEKSAIAKAIEGVEKTVKAPRFGFGIKKEKPEPRRGPGRWAYRGK